MKILLFVFLVSYSQAQDSINIDFLRGAKIVVDPYQDLAYYDEGDLIVIDIPRGKKKVGIKVLEGNKCLERDGCYEGQGNRNSNEEQNKPVFIFKPFSFSDFDY
jgi:hypothetical protein